MATAKDPVCAMDVDTANPPGGTALHNGTTYYFCGAGCKKAFEADPARYTS
jgi:YHS domain-containing protein